MAGLPGAGEPDRGLCRVPHGSSLARGRRLRGAHALRLRGHGHRRGDGAAPAQAFRPTHAYASLVLPILPLVQLIGRGGLTEVSVFQLVAAGTFYAVACGAMQWKTLGYAAGVLYNAALWVAWSQMGWLLADHPQFYLVPVGLSVILFAQSNRRELGRDLVNTIRSGGLITTYLAMAAPIWQFRSFGDWVALLVGSLMGLFVGIGLRIQTFVWLGLVTFLADVTYELGRVSMDHVAGEVGHHALAGHHAGLLRRTQREEADCLDDAGVL